MSYARFAKQIISVVAALIGVALVAGFLSAWMPFADSVAHFRFHLTAALALAVVALLMFRSHWSAAVAGAVTIAGIAGLGPALPFRVPAEDVGAEPSVTLVQLNLSFRNRTPQAVADFVRGEGADVVTLQEVTGRTGRVIELLDKDYPYRVVCPFARVGGVAVISRLPKALGESQGCVARGGLAWLRVMADGRPVSFASVHLHWPYPFNQAPQIDRLEGPLRNIPRPVIVAGDFNATPWSHAVARMAAASETEIAEGLRFTFRLQPVPWFPAVGMPIDHVLVPAGIMPTAVTAGPGPGSDHRAVVARLALLPAAGDGVEQSATASDFRP